MRCVCTAVTREKPSFSRHNQEVVGHCDDPGQHNYERHGSKKSASTLTLLQSSSSAFKVFSSPLQHATSLIIFFYLGPPCISLDLNLCLSQIGNGIFNCSLLTDFRGIPDLPLGRNILGLSLTTGAFTQQLPMMFTSISEFDPGRLSVYSS